MNLWALLAIVVNALETSTSSHSVPVLTDLALPEIVRAIQTVAIRAGLAPKRRSQSVTLTAMLTLVLGLGAKDAVLVSATRDEDH